MPEVDDKPITHNVPDSGTDEVPDKVELIPIQEHMAKAAKLLNQLPSDLIPALDAFIDIRNEALAVGKQRERRRCAEICRNMEKSNSYYASVETDRDLKLNYDGRAWVLGLVARHIEEGNKR